MMWELRSGRRPRRSPMVVLVLGLCVGMGGCKEPAATVHGTVSLDGRPLAVADGMRGTVVFQPAEGSGVTSSGMIDSQGRFELAAGSSRSIMPGPYLVTISAVEIIRGSEPNQQPSGKQVTPAKYARPDSGFRIEVVPGPNEVNLALSSQPEGKPPDDGGAADPQAPVEANGDDSQPAKQFYLEARELP